MDIAEAVEYTGEEWADLYPKLKESDSPPNVEPIDYPLCTAPAHSNQSTAFTLQEFKRFIHKHGGIVKRD